MNNNEETNFEEWEQVKEYWDALSREERFEFAQNAHMNHQTANRWADSDYNNLDMDAQILVTQILRRAEDMKRKYANSLPNASAQAVGVLAIYDNGGKTADRYTVVLDPKIYITVRSRTYPVLGLSDDVYAPNGFSQWGSTEIGPHLGKKIEWSQLPPRVQKHIVERLTNE